jgi:hypothetical protein
MPAAAPWATALPHDGDEDLLLLAALPVRLSRPAASPDQQMQAGLERRLETSRHPQSRCHPAWRVGIGRGRASLHRDAPSKPLAQGQPILGQPCSREPRTSAEPSTIHQAEGMLVLEGR